MTERMPPIDLPVARWGYNPSRWRERIAVGVLGVVAAAIATYLSLYQWRLIDSAWDPWFETERVLDSEVSHQLYRWIRLPDAFLGTLAYLGDALFALGGCTRRWQYRPWLVFVFGLDVIPLSIVSATLVVLQGTVVGDWCFLCLVTAAISLILVYLAYPEVWTMIVYVYRVWRETRSAGIVWKTFCGVPTAEGHRVAQHMVEASRVA